MTYLMQKVIRMLTLLMRTVILAWTSLVQKVYIDSVCQYEILSVFDPKSSPHYSECFLCNKSYFSTSIKFLSIISGRTYILSMMYIQVRTDKTSPLLVILTDHSFLRILGLQFIGPVPMIFQNCYPDVLCTWKSQHVFGKSKWIKISSITLLLRACQKK